MLVLGLAVVVVDGYRLINGQDPYTAWGTPLTLSLVGAGGLIALLGIGRRRRWARWLALASG